MDSSSKFFFSFSVNYGMIVKLVDLIVLLGSKLLNRFRKIFNISKIFWSLFDISQIFRCLLSTIFSTFSRFFASIPCFDSIPLDIQYIAHISCEYHDL